jgi:hypothetical protein
VMTSALPKDLSSVDGEAPGEWGLILSPAIRA